MTKEETTEVREFEGIEVTYPPEDICIYPEYKGKPYFGIRYRENGESIVGYGTYNPQVLSRYLKDYFMSTTKNDIRYNRVENELNRVKNELNRVKDELEPTTKNCESCRYYGSHHEVCNYCYKCSLWTEKELTTKNDLADDCIDRVELLKAMNTYDKFGNDSNERLVFLSTPALQDRYVPYVHYDEMVNCVKGMPTVTPQQPKTGYLSIDNVMSVFDDFMCGKVDEEGTETFLEMLKDKSESEDKEWQSVNL